MVFYLPTMDNTLRPKFSRFFKINNFLIFGIIYGIVIMLFNFAQFRSLWQDEGRLALNFFQDWGFIFKPLENETTAPVGFLFLMKLLFELFNHTDWSIRLLPLFSSLLSIYIIYLNARYLWRDKTIALIVAFFLSITPSVWSYSNEGKQYALDLLMGQLFLFFTLRAYRNKNDEKILLTTFLFFAVGIWFSYISVVMIVPCLIFLGMYFGQSNKARFRSYIIVVLISYGVYYGLFVYNHPLQGLMREQWLAQNGFLPKNIFSVAFYSVLVRKVYDMFEIINFTSFKFIPFVIVILSVFAVKKKYLVLLLGPLIVLLGMAYIQLYPLALRYYLFFAPFLLLIIGGMFKKSNFVGHRIRYFNRIIFVLLLWAGIVGVVNVNYPIKKQEVKAALQYAINHKKGGENIYAAHATYYVVKFYQQSIPELSNVPILIKQSDYHSAPSQSDIKAMGNVVWVVGAVEFWNTSHERDLIETTLKKNGFYLAERKAYYASFADKYVKIDN